jgi:Fe-S-cluster containining protein
MQRRVAVTDISIFGEMDMLYNQVRVLEAKQNQTKFKCLGKGDCCKIGITIHMAECANIAYNINKQYYLDMENKGEEFAKDNFNKVIAKLKNAMYDNTWEFGGETKKWCALYDNGCTIYGFRPMVCRSFGTIVGVDDYCPRIRNAYGNIDFFAGEPVEDTIRQFQLLLKKYAKDKDSNYDVVVFMPLGVLSFLISTEELQELSNSTDDKMWRAVQGWYNYRVEYTKVHGLPLPRLKQEAKDAGGEIGFKIDEDSLGDSSYTEQV